MVEKIKTDVDRLLLDSKLNNSFQYNTSLNKFLVWRIDGTTVVKFI